ncbi:MAG: single-stranded-DNA-specific exonuclease RecJ [Flavobacteriaceae bacterium]|nr:single-stranded-DNA-specific exonuclease RecJ [Flavobacteriaceae bacterium]
MSIRWLLKPVPDAGVIDRLQSDLNLPSALTHILAQRGVSDFDDAKAFFRPNMANLHDPYLLKDMDKAVSRIKQAIQNEENIMIYGDYDVDGTTSVALMYLFLKSIYPNITYYIPDRYSEGYGISELGIDYAADNGVSLIIALDCGVKAVDKIDYANSKQVDFVICDHHLPGPVLPKAIAVLDPKRTDCSYPYKGLSGCGVGFKLVQALAAEFDISDEVVYSYLDLVVVSIAADIVPITGENRILAHFGLKVLNSNPRLGLSMLIPKESAGNLNISKIVFSIAPKINAAGRIKHASDAVKLLISENEMTARGYVSEINSLNTERKNIDAEITDAAITQIRENQEEDRFSTVVYNPEWHKGVIGIVASRLTEVYYRPTVVFTKGENGFLVASARSVREFDVHEALSECSDLLDRFGGHMYAAGLTMHEVNLPNFKRKFEQIVAKNITQTQRIPTIEIDTELRFSEINDKFIRLLKQFQPFGPENMAPQFLTKNVQFAGNDRLMGVDKQHLKIDVFHPDERRIFTAVGFGMGNWIKKIKSTPFDMVYSIEENIWQGKAHLQLLIKDIKFSD